MMDIVRIRRSLWLVAGLGLLACPAPCPEPDAASEWCAPEEPGGVAIANASFEATGAPLADWTLKHADGVIVRTVPGVDGCTALSLVTPHALARPAQLLHMVDARALRGQRVRLSFWARVELVHPKRAPNFALGVRKDRPSNIIEMAGARLTGEHWGLHSLELDVPADAERLEIAIGLWDVRRIEVDGVALDRIGPACPGCEAATALTPGERERLVALTQLLAHMRYFHPGPEDEAADWDALALFGVQAALRASDTDALTLALERVAPNVPARPDKPHGFRPDGGDRTTRLAAIALLGARISHFSPRLGLLRRPWADVLGDSFERAALAGTRYELRDEVFRLLAALHDGAAQAHLDWDARLMYTLAVGWRWIDGQLVITRVEPQMPELQLGDVVEAIDGRATAAILQELLPISTSTTEARGLLRAGVFLGRGFSGTPRQLQVRRIDGSEHVIRVPFRDVGLARSVKPAPIREMGDGVVYIDLSNSTANDLTAAAGSLQAARAVVLDARAEGLGKGLRERFQAALGDIGGEQVVTTTSPEPWVPDPAALELPAQIAVLIDETSAGAVEGLADALRTLRSARLIGSASAGVPSKASVIDLPGGIKVGLSETPYRYLGGQSGLGPVQPDVAMRPTVAGIAAGRDELLERALAMLDGSGDSCDSAGACGSHDASSSLR